MKIIPVLNALISSREFHRYSLLRVKILRILLKNLSTNRNVRSSVYNPLLQLRFVDLINVTGTF